jgi:hypothetical protein
VVGARRVDVRHPLVVVGLLVVVQWIALVAFVLTVRHNGWLFYQGGDETFFYTTSSTIAHGHIPEATIGYGWSYLLAPVALLCGSSLLSALPIIVLLQTVVLLPLALWCVYGIVERIGGRSLGYVAAVIWVAAPYAAIPLWDGSYHAKYVEQFLPQWLGLTALGDQPSMVCLLVAALLCIRALDSANPLDDVLAGVAAGFAIAIKPSNALFLAAPAVAFVAARQPRTLIRFGVALLPAVVTLVLWKYRGLGHVPLLTRTETSVTSAASASPSALPQADIVVGRYLDLDWSQLRRNYVDLRSVFWGLTAWQVLPLLGVFGAVRRSAPKTLLLVVWLASFVLVKGTSQEADIDSGSLLRLFMPGFPPVVMLVALIPLLVEDVGMTTPIALSALRLRGAAIVAAVFAAIPLLLVLSLSPVRDASVAKYFDENVFVPVADLSLAARGARGRTVLSWHRPRSPGVDVFYRVFRSAPVAPAPDPSLPPGRAGIRCLDAVGGWAGASDCRLEMTTVGVTPRTSFTDRAPPGRWVYRVGVVANWRNVLTGGDTMLVSRAVAATT